ncbi:MAG: epoxyqueuosine reductase [Deltaproteobacteria bacterium]|nr:epoxyqueuosine reductase [Deltaproteobacteria bacterium]
MAPGARLLDDVRELADRELVDRFGVSDLSPVRDEIARQGGELPASFPRAISLGIDLAHAVVDALDRREERGVAVAYRRMSYEVINQRLNLAGSRVASLLQRAGHRAFPMTASDRADDERICAMFSHKLAARQAGLGWIGRSCLLVTPDAGPRVRWTTVLTDAPLEPTGSPIANGCGECSECVDICPVGAFSGRLFEVGEPREARFDASKCDQYFKSMYAEADWKVCGLCLYACPHGRQ